MDFNLTSEQIAFQKLAAEFARNHMAPYAAMWDREHIFPLPTLRLAADLGFAGIYIRDDVGGANLSRLDAALIFEQLATACPSTAAYLSIHNMVSWLIDAYGTPEQRQCWLPKLARMQLLGSYCLTEPHAGSDAAALTTNATREGNDYIINGCKAFISGGTTSDLYLCMVRTSELGAKGITCLIIEKDRPGISFGKQETKLGWHSQSTSMVFFTNCRVPVTNLIGSENEGFKIALHALDGGRVNIAACSLGGAKACLESARQYMHEREQFNQKLVTFQTLQFTFSDMFTALESARLLTYRAATSLDQKHPDKTIHCAMAKQIASEIGFKIADQSLQIYGGYGYLNDYPIERYFRDLRVHRILEGTNEIMRLIIARQCLQLGYSL